MGSQGYELYERTPSMRSHRSDQFHMPSRDVDEGLKMYRGGSNQSSGLRRGIVTGSFSECSLLWGTAALVDAGGVVCEWNTSDLLGGVPQEDAPTLKIGWVWSSEAHTE